MFESLTQYAKKKSHNTFKNIKEHSCIEQVAILHDLVVTGKKACISVVAIKVKSKKYKMNFPRNYFLEIKKI